MAVAVIAVLEMLIRPFVGQEIAPFLLFPVAVSIGAGFGGFGPGLLATFLGILVNIYFFLPPVHTFWLSTHDAYELTAALFAGSGISYFTLARDRARSALRLADERSADALRQWVYVFDHAGWGIVLVTPPDYMIRAVNTSYATLHGYTQEELIGRPVAETIAPEARAAMEDNIQTAYEQGHHIYESVHLRKDGTTFPVLIDFAALKDPSGKALFGAAYCQDITDRRQLEEQFHQAQKLESLGVLAAGLAHDFNNLLVSILGNASLAMEAQPAASPLRNNLGEIVRASEKAADLTRQMLAYSGKGQFIVGPVDLSAVVRENDKLLQSTVPRNVHLAFDLAPNMPSIEADRSQIQQLVLNLVANAAEAIGDQPGRVEVSTRGELIDAETVRNEYPGQDLQPGIYACLEVTDTGTGMDEETVSRIFDPFFTTKFPGRGLGLAAVSGIVRSQRGCLKVRSKVGEGSTFQVFLPGTAPQPTAHSKKGSGTATRI